MPCSHACMHACCDVCVAVQVSLLVRLAVGMTASQVAAGTDVTLARWLAEPATAQAMARMYAPDAVIRWLHTPEIWYQAKVRPNQTRAAAAAAVPAATPLWPAAVRRHPECCLWPEPLCGLPGLLRVTQAADLMLGSQNIVSPCVSHMLPPLLCAVLCVTVCGVGRLQARQSSTALSPGAAAGIAVGCTAAVSAAVVLAAWMVHRRKQQGAPAADDKTDGTDSQSSGRRVSAVMLLVAARAVGCRFQVLICCLGSSTEHFGGCSRHASLRLASATAAVAAAAVRLRPQAPRVLCVTHRSLPCLLVLRPCCSAGGRASADTCCQTLPSMTPSPPQAQVVLARLAWQHLQGRSLPTDRQTATALRTKTMLR